MLEKIFSLISNPVYALAEDAPPPQIAEIGASIDNLFGYILPVGVLISVAMIVYGGYMWIISGGDPSRKQVAQGTLTWAVLGLIFLFLIKAILSIVLSLVM